jgi:hypothetical protein
MSVEYCFRHDDETKKNDLTQKLQHLKFQKNQVPSCEFSEHFFLHRVRLFIFVGKKRKSKNSKTYNSRYSLVVTHPTTNLPI